MANRMALAMATAMANRMAKPMRSLWQNDAPNPNPNPNPNPKTHVPPLQEKSFRTFPESNGSHTHIDSLVCARGGRR